MRKILIALLASSLIYLGCGQETKINSAHSSGNNSPIEISEKELGGIVDIDGDGKKELVYGLQTYSHTSPFGSDYYIFKKGLESNSKSIFLYKTDNRPETIPMQYIKGDDPRYQKIIAVVEDYLKNERVNFNE